MEIVVFEESKQELNFLLFGKLLSSVLPSLEVIELLATKLLTSLYS
jgi:hypothetical protein